MKEKISEIFLNSMFEYDGFPCYCVKDIENLAPGEHPKTTLKLYCDLRKRLRFSYVPREGLNLTGKAGGEIEKNILGKVLALPATDIDQYISFFEQYGFLLPVSGEEYESIQADIIIEVFNRIKATIRLMNALGKRDYKRMLIHATYLLFSPKIAIHTAENTYATCSHKFNELLDSYNIFPDLNKNPEVFVKGTYSVDDLIIGAKNQVDVEFYNAVRSGSETSINGSRDRWFKNIVAMYTGYQTEDLETRLIIDFYYNFQKSYSAIKSVSYNTLNLYSQLDVTELNDEMRNGLEKIARTVVAKEINHNISGIHPKYDGYSLTASWQVDTLIQALYFSIFYMKAGVEIYKECENPNCKRDKYFLVEATRSNKRYCCEKCRAAASAQRHRNRMQ